MDTIGEAARIHALILQAVEVAFRVRQKQKHYFKTRNKEDLIAAKLAEKTLDEKLKALGYDLEN